jgi:hypothetical protein
MTSKIQKLQVHTGRLQHAHAVLVAALEHLRAVLVAALEQ